MYTSNCTWICMYIDKFTDAQDVDWHGASDEHVCVCVRDCAHMYLHIYIYICINKSLYLCTNLLGFKPMRKNMMDMVLVTDMFVCVCVCAYIYIYIYIYICMNNSIYVYVYLIMCKQMRKIMIDMVLATDMAEHQRIVSLLRQVNDVQHTATQYITLQHITTHCNVSVLLAFFDR